MFSPRTEVEKRLSSETAELKSDISNLNKKLHYLETTHKNSRDHIDQIFKSGGRAWMSGVWFLRRLITSGEEYLPTQGVYDLSGHFLCATGIDAVAGSWTGTIGDKADLQRPSIRDTRCDGCTTSADHSWGWSYFKLMAKILHGDKSVLMGNPFQLQC